MQEKTTKSSLWPHLLLLFFIGLVSAYDSVLMVVYDGQVSEQNPVGEWLLSMGGTSLLVTLKATLTLIVIFCCVGLLKTKYRYIIAWLALFQFILFYYLTFTSPKCYMDYSTYCSPMGDFFSFYFNFFAK